LQGIYRNDERDGPGLVCYTDGRYDVGLWKRDRLVRIASAVDNPFSLTELGYGVLPDSEDRPTAWQEQRVARSRREVLERCSVTAAPAQFQYPWTPDIEELAAAVLRDTLPPTCVAADLQALDDAFIAEDYDAFIGAVERSLLAIQDDAARRHSTGSDEDGDVLKTRRDIGAVVESGKLYRPPPRYTTDAQPIHGGLTALPAIPDSSLHQSSTSATMRMDGKTTAGPESGATKQVLPPIRANAHPIDGANSMDRHAGNLQPLPHQPHAGSAMKELMQAEGSGHMQPDLQGSSITKRDSQSVQAVGVTEGGGSRQFNRVTQAPSAVLAGIEAVLRGDQGSGSADLGLDPGRPGPLQLLSERFIAAAGSGDLDTVIELLGAGLVSADVADSTGLTAILAASVRIVYEIPYKLLLFRVTVVKSLTLHIFCCCHIFLYQPPGY